MEGFAGDLRLRAESPGVERNISFEPSPQPGEIRDVNLPDASYLASRETAEPHVPVDGHVVDAEALGRILQADGFHHSTRYLIGDRLALRIFRQT